MKSIIFLLKILFISSLHKWQTKKLFNQSLIGFKIRFSLVLRLVINFSTLLKCPQKYCHLFCEKQKTKQYLHSILFVIMKKHCFCAFDWRRRRRIKRRRRRRSVDERGEDTEDMQSLASIADQKRVQTNAVDSRLDIHLRNQINSINEEINCIRILIAFENSLQVFD